MIDTIKNHHILKEFVAKSCCENDITVTFDDSIANNSYVIIKVDKFYNSQKLAMTPASIDCLIVRKCTNGGYGLTLVELKNIKKGRRINLKNTKEKFNTTLHDFIQIRFQTLFDLDYREIKLYFVSKYEINRRDLGLKMEVLMNVQFRFKNKTLTIHPRMPNPTIKNCYT